MESRPDLTGEPPAVVVVVASRDRPDKLQRALAAIKGAIRGTDDVVVVDSGSATRATAEVANQAGVRLIRVDEPGASVARNIGTAATTEALVAFTDDDCLPQPGWAAAVSRAFLDPAVGLVTGRLLPASPQSATVVIELREERRRFCYPDEPSQIGSGANMAVRRSAFDAIGGFDERMGPAATFPAAEDHDVFFRLLREGWGAVYEPDAVVVHDDQRTRPQVVRRMFTYGVGTGAVTRKVLQLDRPVGRRMLRDRLWDSGLREIPRDLRAHSEVQALAHLMMLAGVAWGVVRSTPVSLSEGRFVRRTRKS